jgi:hypothetical protein
MNANTLAFASRTASDNLSSGLFGFSWSSDLSAFPPSLAPFSFFGGTLHITGVLAVKQSLLACYAL